MRYSVSPAWTVCLANASPLGEGAGDAVGDGDGLSVGDAVADGVASFVGDGLDVGTASWQALTSTRHERSAAANRHGAVDRGIRLIVIDVSVGEVGPIVGLWPARPDRR